MSENILSVGIDIGTSTTSIVFSDIVIENASSSVQLPRAEIVEKKVRYRSPIYFTPLLSNTELDVDKIRDIVAGEYQAAGIMPGDVQTGAVIITGDTARKSNAKKCLEAISLYAGDFVVATAGPSLESILAGKGSGADVYSKKNRLCVCNMDIGGGTTNTAAFDNGRLADADCFDVGGRLIRFAKGSRTIEFIFPKIRELAAEAGIKAEVGGSLSTGDISRITDRMAQALMDKLRGGKERICRYLRTESGPPTVLKADSVSFSGGVGKLIYDEDLPPEFAYDDIGVFLARSVRKAVADSGFELIKPAETISATVIGAGNHTMEVSGSTITVTDFSRLPLKNVPIIRVESADDGEREELRERIERSYSWMQGVDGDQEVALFLDIDRKLGFKDVTIIADNLVYGTDALRSRQGSLLLLLKGDYGKVLGQSLRVRLPKDCFIVCVDSVDAGSGDFIDIGKPLGIGDSLPVVIKTLAFSY